MCPNADGAAAVIVSRKPPKSSARKTVRVLSSVVTSGKFSQGFRDLTVPEISIRAARNAYEMAGIGPQDVDLAEVHDAASIAEVIYYEALGFCEPGVKRPSEGRFRSIQAVVCCVAAIHSVQPELRRSSRSCGT